MDDIGWIMAAAGILLVALGAQLGNAWIHRRHERRRARERASRAAAAE